MSSSACACGVLVLGSSALTVSLSASSASLPGLSRLMAYTAPCRNLNAMSFWTQSSAISITLGRCVSTAMRMMAMMRAVTVSGSATSVRGTRSGSGPPTKPVLAPLLPGAPGAPPAEDAPVGVTAPTSPLRPLLAASAMSSSAKCALTAAAEAEAACCRSSCEDGGVRPRDLELPRDTGALASGALPALAPLLSSSRPSSDAASSAGACTAAADSCSAS
mmetsp:Transcript_33177/g.84229  ORF Transcript_33177/g.84229 Transcript_33177/m.84229 type:complete len:219 (-) Transcript_33177:494-1150(-)